MKCDCCKEEITGKYYHIMREKTLKVKPKSITDLRIREKRLFKFSTIPTEESNKTVCKKCFYVNEHKPE